MRLQLPSVSAHIFDDAGRLLLVRHRDGDAWSTPGGFIEPDERPSDAVVRETWEETGLMVCPSLRSVLPEVYSAREEAAFYPARWTPAT